MRRSLTALLGTGLVAGTLATSLAASPAFAQDRPILVPTRDVSVVYHLGSDAQRSLRMSWHPETQQVRIDPPQNGQGPGGWMLLNLKDKKGQMVIDAQKIIMDLPVTDGQLARFTNPGANAQFTREGTDKIAGYSCTIWKRQEGTQSGTACVTADGVVLRAQDSSSPQNVLEAAQVSYGPQNASLFQVPSGYQEMKMPSFGDRGNALPPPGVNGQR